MQHLNICLIMLFINVLYDEGKNNFLLSLFFVIQIPL